MSGERGVRNGDRTVPEERPDDAAPRVARPARGHPSPPQFSRLLLHRVLPRDVRDGAVAELDDKFRTHIASGMAPRRARRWYRRQVFGALHPRFWARPFRLRSAIAGGAKGRSSLLSNLQYDIRFGLRMLARNPAMTGVIVITLAVGLGFNGAIFSLVNTIIRNDLPIEAPERVLFIESDNPAQGRERLPLSYADYRDFADASRSFATMAAYDERNMNLSDGIEVPERYAGAALEPSIFDVLQIEPEIGRRFEPADAEPGAANVALIGYNVWRTRYGADPEILGRVVQLNARPVTVVGVLPAELQRSPLNPAVWIPLVPSEQMRNDRDRRYLLALGRLHPEASREDAVAELEQIAALLAAEHRETNEGVGVVVGTFRETFTETGNETITLILMGAVLFLLLIACANVANLLVSRSIERRREVVVRSALGASRWRVVRQLLVESLLLSGIAAIAACFLTLWGSRMLERAISAAAPPEFWDFSVRPSVFAFIVGLSLFTGVLFGLMPALHATRRDVNEGLKDGGRGSGGTQTRRLTGSLVVAQVALSLVLLAGAGVMVRSTLNVLDIDWSVDPDNVLTMRVTLPEATYPERDNIIAFHDELDRRIAALPGVEAVALTSTFPTSIGYSVAAELEGLPLSDGNPPAPLTQLIVSPAYFELAGITPLRGRLFDRSDRLDDEPVLVIERHTAERYWPGEDPIGKRLRWIGEQETRWVRVVGVILDQNQTLELSFFDEHPRVYTPVGQEPLRTIGLMVRSPADPAALATRLREQVQQMDANLPLFSIAPLAQVISERSVSWRVVSVLFMLLGAVALLLACIGVYALMVFAVGSREQEIGIRMALGARSGEIVRLVARTSLAQVVIGLALGLAGALAMSRVLGMFMYEVSPTDPPTFVVVLLVLVATATASVLIPARRASNVDPVETLRGD